MFINSYLNYLFSSIIRNPNAGIPKLINAKAFTAGCIMPKPVAIKVGNIAHIEKSFLSLRKIFGKYLLGKNMQKPAMYTHKIANSSKSCPIIHKINLYIYIYIKYTYIYIYIY